MATVTIYKDQVTDDLWNKLIQLTGGNIADTVIDLVIYTQGQRNEHKGQQRIKFE